MTAFVSLLKGASRAEYEYEIPTDEATEMLDTLCPRYARRMLSE
jgi:CYTH domain-containing protein